MYSVFAQYLIPIINVTVLNVILFSDAREPQKNKVE